jgi:hypothetical protein
MLKKEIEEYVANWHWDNQSKQYAFDLGKFLFSFIEYLNDSNLSERVKKSHKNNLQLIGSLQASYGYVDEFNYEDLTNGPHYNYEFKRKVSDSEYAIKSYESTWRKLDKFIKSGDFKTYLSKIEEELKKP